MNYEKGLDLLKKYANEKIWQHEFRVYESQLRENLYSEKLYGSDEQVRRNRSRIVDQLNRLAHEQLSISFNDLCLLRVPSVQSNSRVDYSYGMNSDIHQPGAFVCYSHKDRRYLDELRIHLSHQIRMGAISCWDDTQILPGANWKDVVKSALIGAQAAILLVSADFFNSDFIMQYELPILLDAERKQEVLIWCVVVRPCSFKDTELARFQAVNDPAIPLSTMSYGKREMVWVRVAELVRDKLLSVG